MFVCFGMCLLCASLSFICFAPTTFRESIVVSVHGCSVLCLCDISYYTIMFLHRLWLIICFTRLTRLTDFLVFVFYVSGVIIYVFYARFLSIACSVCASSHSCFNRIFNVLFSCRRCPLLMFGSVVLHLLNVGFHLMLFNASARHRGPFLQWDSCFYVFSNHLPQPTIQDFNYCARAEWIRILNYETDAQRLYNSWTRQPLVKYYPRERWEGRRFVVWRLLGDCGLDVGLGNCVVTLCCWNVPLTFSLRTAFQNFLWATPFWN